MVDSHFLSIVTLFKNKELFDPSYLCTYEKHGFLHVAGWGDILPGKKYAGGVGKGSSTFDNESIFDEQPQNMQETDCIGAFSSQLSPAAFPAV